MKSKDKDNSLKRLAAITIISVVVAACTCVFVFCYFFVDFGEKRETLEIPDFVGKRLEAIGYFDKIKVESEPVFSDEIPEGEIISQFPYGGAKRKLAKGEKYTVKLTVSLGKETQAIPNLQNYKYLDAATALRSIGARIKIVSIYDDEVERDLVLRTLPKAGESIERGDSVTLFVSRNHVHGSVCVKNFVGMSQSDAIAEILAQGLCLGEMIEEKSEEYPEGCVVSQSVLQGSYVLYGTKIDIVINTRDGADDIHPFRKDLIQKYGELNESVN